MAAGVALRACLYAWAESRGVPWRCQRRQALGGRDSVAEFYSNAHPRAGVDDTVVFDLRRWRAGCHQHGE